MHQTSASVKEKINKMMPSDTNLSFNIETNYPPSVQTKPEVINNYEYLLQQRRAESTVPITFKRN